MPVDLREGCSMGHRGRHGCAGQTRAGRGQTESSRARDKARASVEGVCLFS